MLFERRSLKSAPRYVVAVLVSVAAAITFAAAFAVLLARAAGLPLATLVLATAPGGLAEMCITAKVLQLGVLLVTAAHVTRVVVSDHDHWTDVSLCTGSPVAVSSKVSFCLQWFIQNLG